LEEKLKALLGLLSSEQMRHRDGQPDRDRSVEKELDRHRPRPHDSRSPTPPPPPSLSGFAPRQQRPLSPLSRLLAEKRYSNFTNAPNPHL
jgi:hypothetical protein